MGAACDVQYRTVILLSRWRPPVAYIHGRRRVLFSILSLSHAYTNTCCSVAQFTMLSAVLLRAAALSLLVPFGNCLSSTDTITWGGDNSRAGYQT